jgi:hypothetical protein
MRLVPWDVRIFKFLDGVVLSVVGKRCSTSKVPGRPVSAFDDIEKRSVSLVPAWVLFALLVLLIGRPCWARGSADELLGLVPANAGATLVIEDLRTHARTFLESPLAESLTQLPTVKAWFASDRHRDFARARRDIQNALKVDLPTLRDDLLGDAVVFSLVVPEGAGPDAAKGLVLVRFRDRALLDRVVATINTGEKQDGALVDLVDKTHGGITFHARKFKPGTKPDEFYAILGKDVFVWSNSEALVRDAIDRQSKPSGLNEQPRFRKVREALPGRAVASFFVDPRFVERVGAAAPGNAARNRDDAWGAFLTRYIEAVEYAGAAFEWRDGFVLHVHEVVDATKLDEPLRRWAARTGGASALLSRVPPTALALMAAHVDVQALFDEVMARLPDSSRPKAENFATVLRGILLGKDPRGEIFSVMGPGMVVYLDEPKTHWAEQRPALVLAVAIGGAAEQSASASAAIENALNTLFALSALDNKPENARLRVETREINGIRVTGLAGGKSPVYFAMGPGFVVLGNVPEAVASFAAENRQSSDAQFVQTRTEYFPKSETFAYADLERLRRFATDHRAGIAKRIAADHGKPHADALRDLDQALALMSVFRAGFATSSVAADYSWAHRTLGLLARLKQ